MDSGIKYNFKAKIWQHESPGGWYFVALPKDMSEEIRAHLKSLEQGWGRLSAKAKIKDIEWKTAIWFDTKRETYLLPLKAEIRKKAELGVDEMVEVTISV